MPTQCPPNISILFSSLISDEQSVSLFPEIIAPSQNETKDVEIGKKTLTVLAHVAWKILPYDSCSEFPKWRLGY